MDEGGLWLTHGPRVARPYESAVLYSDARQRVLGSKRLRPYLDIIFSDWAGGDGHLRWVIRGKVSEIESWAKQIREGGNG